MGAQTLAWAAGSPWRLPRRAAALPVVLVLLFQIDVWAPASYNLGHVVGPRPVVALLYTVTALSLAWRMRAPVAVLAFVVTADAAEYLAFGAPEGLGSIVPTAVALYSVGRYAGPAALASAGPLALLGVVVHELTDPEYVFGGPSAVLYALLAAAWPLGQTFQRHTTRATALTERAEALAAERERVAGQAVTTERGRIARELHDVIGHGVSVTVLQLVAAQGLLDKPDPAAAAERLGNAERSARRALAEMRRLLGLLDPVEQTEGFAAQPGLAHLDQLVADTRAAGAEVTVRVNGAPLELPAGVDLAAFRIVQECLTNVLKHSEPPVCSVQVDYASDAVVLSVVDEGRGVPPEGGIPGRGLAGMRERVAVYHGELTARPRPDGGFAVRARLPVAE
jgi:signal transduction histidine kinase